MAVADRIPACDAAGPYDVILDEERRRPKKGKTRASASSWSSSSPSPPSFYVSPFAALLAMEIMAGVEFSAAANRTCTARAITSAQPKKQRLHLTNGVRASAHRRMPAHTMNISCQRAQKLLRARASMCCKQRCEETIEEIRITCTRATFAFHNVRKNFLEHARKFFVREITKRVVARPNIFSQADGFGRSQNAESIKNERISAK